MKKKIIIKTAQQINNIRIAGQYHNELIIKLQDASKTGVSLIQLEEIAQAFIKKNNLIGSFKWYNWFPANLCLSVNDCLVHGIPDKTVLQNGDLLKIDCGITYQQCIADAAISLVIGGEFYNTDASRLITTTKDGLDHAIQFIQPGKAIYHYSKAIYEYMTTRGFKVIKVLTGHGVGVRVHEPPYIYNRPHPETKSISFQPGMVIAIEPITAEKSDDYKEKPGNKRNLYTQKGDLWAQREYTILITKDGHEILAGIT